MGLIVALVLIGALFAGGAVAIALYDIGTEPDRSTPIISTDAFLDAVYFDGNAATVGLYTCATWPASDALASMKSLVDSDVRTTWDTLSVVSQDGDDAELRARMRFQYPGEVAPSGEKVWTFKLVDEDGWRVCSITTK